LDFVDHLFGKVEEPRIPSDFHDEAISVEIDHSLLDAEHLDCGQLPEVFGDRTALDDLFESASCNSVLGTPDYFKALSEMEFDDLEFDVSYFEDFRGRMQTVESPALRNRFGLFWYLTGEPLHPNPWSYLLFRPVRAPPVISP
jgi:hypothetical protein